MSAPSSPFSPPDLHGRVAIVTGASRGIGRELALALARAGCDVAIAAKSTEPRPGLPGSIHQTREAVEALGRRAIAVPTDVRHDDALEALVSTTREQLGRIDILVNNAGALWWKDVVDTPLRRFDLVMGVNARATFALSRLCVPVMVEQGWGHIINMSPPVDLQMLPGKVAYCISKFGMTLVAHGLAAELRGKPVSVNALWPATLIDSQATRNFGLGSPAQWRKPEILCDASLAILGHAPGELTGQALLDEEILAQVGVEDLEGYSCVPGGKPLRIVVRRAATEVAPADSPASRFGHGAGGPATHTPG